MQNGTVGGMPAQSDDRHDIHHAVVADLASLIERIQASLTLIDHAGSTGAAEIFERAVDSIVDDLRASDLSSPADLARVLDAIAEFRARIDTMDARVSQAFGFGEATLVP